MERAFLTIRVNEQNVFPFFLLSFVYIVSVLYSPFLLPLCGLGLYTAFHVNHWKSFLLHWLVLSSLDATLRSIVVVVFQANTLEVMLLRIA